MEVRGRRRYEGEREEGNEVRGRRYGGERGRYGGDRAEVWRGEGGSIEGRGGRYESIVLCYM